MDAGDDPTLRRASIITRRRTGGASGGVFPPRETTTAADSPQDARAAENTDDLDTPTEAMTPRCAIEAQETQWIPPNRRSNHPGRPRARFRAACSMTGGGAGSSAAGRYVLGMQIPISGNEGTMAGTAQSGNDEKLTSYTLNRRGKACAPRPHPGSVGRTAIGLVAFIVGGIAVVFQIWPMFWAAVALAVIALIVTVVLQRMGYGAG